MCTKFKEWNIDLELIWVAVYLRKLHFLLNLPTKHDTVTISVTPNRTFTHSRFPHWLVSNTYKFLFQIQLSTKCSRPFNKIISLYTQFIFHFHCALFFLIRSLQESDKWEIIFILRKYQMDASSLFAYYKSKILSIFVWIISSVEKWRIHVNIQMSNFHFNLHAPMKNNQPNKDVIHISCVKCKVFYVHIQRSYVI